MTQTSLDPPSQAADTHTLFGNQACVRYPVSLFGRSLEMPISRIDKCDQPESVPSMSKADRTEKTGPGKTATSEAEWRKKLTPEQLLPASTAPSAPLAIPITRRSAKGCTGASASE